MVKRPRRNPRPKKSQVSVSDFHRQVRDKSTRKLKAKQEEEYSVWYGLGMMGIVGWSVAIPTLIGVAIGLWIDLTWSSPFPWTLILLLVGVLVGCFNAWYWIQHERPNE